MKILVTGGGGRAVALARATKVRALLRAPVMDDRQEHSTMDGSEEG
ncbi:Rossmann-fold NAD(P)-binding domain-containing protein [Pseudoluteimonas lycopersici]|nr:hypothetical protein [Lysobacter lycopersici]